MADQGATFQIDLAVGGASAVDTAATSLDTLSKRLDAGQDSYKAAQSNADKTAKSLERMGIAAEAQKGKLEKAMAVGDLSGAEKASARLNALTIQQGLAASKAGQAKAALDQEAASLDKLTKEQGAAADAAKKATAATEKSADEGTGNARKIASGLGKLGGPLGAIGQKAFETKEAFNKLQEGFGDAAPEVVAAVGAAAVAAAFVAVAAAAIAGVAALGAWAVGLADTARSQELLSEGIAKSVAGGKKLDAQINSLATQVPLTTEELSSMAEGLAKTGLKGDALASTLQKNAIAAAKLKFGPDFADQMDSLEEQSKKLKLGISSIFGGLKIDGLLKQLSTLTDLFSDNDAAGHGLKVMFETLFQPLVDGATGFIPKVRAAFLQLEILALKAAIAVKPYTSKIKELAEGFAVLSAIVIGVVLVVFAAMAASIGIIVLAFINIVQACEEVGSAFISAFNSIKSFLSSWDPSGILSGIGTAMIDGLIGGITNAGPAVVAALKNVATSAIDATKKALGIASPSTVFAEIGMNTAAGMEQGVSSGSDGVQGAIEGMAAPTSATAPASSSAAASSSSGGSGFNFQGAQFTFNGVKDADDAESRFGELLTKLIEGDVSQLGAAVPST